MAGFGGSVKLTGESDYRKAIQNITQDLSKMSSALKTQTADYSANDRATTTAAQKQKQLAQSIQEQQQKMQQAKNALASYTTAMQAQQTRHNALNSEYKKAVQELDRIKAASGETSEEYKKQAEAVDKLGQELTQSTAEMNESKAAMSALKSEINSSQKTINNTQKAIDGLGNEAQESGEKAKKGGDGFTVMKGVLANLASNAIMAAVNALKELGATVVNVGKEAINSYDEFEQLSGGVKKIFDEMDYSKISKDASEAYKNMNMSANEYLNMMANVGANFASTLGDAKGYEVAKEGMQAISDFATGTGKSIDELSEKYQLITKSASSYQSIADQFAGVLPATSADFLEQAQAAGFLSDEYTKITEVPIAEYQESLTKMLTKGVDGLGLLGNTAAEAESTLSGSMLMMQKSWQNLLTGFADENQKIAPLFKNLADSIGLYMGNLLPRITETLKGMSEGIQLAVSELFPRISQMITNHLPKLVENGTKLISSIVQGLVQAIPLLIQGLMVGITALIETLGVEIPNIVNTVIQVVPLIIDQLMANLPTFIQGCITFLMGIVQAIPTVIQNLVAAIPTIITSLIDGLLSGIDALIQGAIQLLTAIVDAIPLIIPPLVEAIPTIINTLIEGLVTAIPQLLNGAIELLMALIEAIPKIIPPLVAAIPQIITAIITTLLENIPLIVQAGVDLLVALVQNLPAIIMGIVQAIPEIITAIVDGFAQGLPQMAEAGLNLIKGVWEGISGAGQWLLDQVTGFFDGIIGGILDFLGINSPSTVMRDKVGKNLADGVGVGFSDEMGTVAEQMAKEGGETVKQLSDGMDSQQTSIMNTAKNLAKAIIATFKAFRPQFAAIGKNISTQIANGVKSASKQVTALVRSMVAAINNAFKSASANFANAGKAIAANVANGINGGKGAATSAAKEVANAIAAAIKSQAAPMRTAGRNLITQLASGLKSGQGTATSAAKTMANAIASAFTSKVSAMKSAGAKMASNLASGIKSGSGTVRSAAQSVANSAASAANGYTETWRRAGVNMAQGLKSGFLSQEWSVKNAVNNMVDRITRSAKERMKIKSPSRVWAEIGDYMAQGMAVGFTDGMRDTDKTMLASMDDMLNGVYDFWGISSPSKVMRDKVGKQLIAGIRAGISANRKTAVNAFGTLQKAMLKAVGKSDYTAAAKNLIKAFDGSIDAAIKRSQAQAKQRWQNWYNAQVKTNEAAQSKLQKKIKATNDKNAKKNLQKELETLQAQKKTLASQYKTLGTDVLKAYNTAIKGATEGVTDALTKNLQSIADAMQKRMDEVNKLISDMGGKLKEYGDLFAIDDKGIIDLEDLNQQTKNIQLYGKNLESLKGKISKSLMDAITSMDIEEGLSFTNKLLNISASELKEYDKAYTAKVNAANNVATRFYRDQVQKIKDDYTQKITKALNEAKKQIETIGKQTMQGFVKGMKSVNWAKDIKSIANDIINSFKKQLKIKSPSKVFMEMGEYSGEGYTIGLADELKGVASIMAAAIPSETGTNAASFAQNPALSSAYDAMTPDKMVSAFKEALYQVKIELDNDEMGRFVDKTVTRLVYN